MSPAQRKILRQYALGILGAVSVSLYIGVIDVENRRPASIEVDGQTIDFTWTDSHQDEDLLIFTDQRDYNNGISHATIYAAVVNRSGQAQNVELMGYFQDDRRRIRDVSVLTEATFDVPVYEEQCTEQEVQVPGAAIGHTTPDMASELRQVCEQVQVGTTQEIRNEWVPLPTKPRDLLEVAKEGDWLALTSLSRKQVQGYLAELKTNPFPVPRNGVLYYKLHIEYPVNDSGDFILEVIGSSGGYGYLR